VSAAATVTATGMRAGPAGIAAYAAAGVPLAMAALPLYVHVPRFYGDALGVSLTALGVVLLGMRLLDALVDPLIGVMSDRLGSRRAWVAVALPMLAVGLVALFVPAAEGETALLVWLAATLAVVYAAFSAATINHGAWGAELSRDPRGRTRITATREAFALLGVVVASVAPSLLAPPGDAMMGMQRFAFAFVPLVALCVIFTLLAPAPSPARRETEAPSLRKALSQPLSDPLFRRLLVVFMANGIASAVPATLVLFFIADVLKDEGAQGLYLGLYFISAAAAMPAWVRLSARYGKIAAWAVAMIASIVAFAGVATLGEGDRIAFATICVLSGFALGADLALPPSLLADIIGRPGAAGGAGAYFGAWTLATKLNLALAAGVALPLLAALGYSPGQSGADGLAALSIVYAIVPCVLKLVALGTLLLFRRSLWSVTR
jgi:GPH family glycoside/pentoside/hexuronide:cation symporter